jgi:hypothetical protein
MDKLGRRMQRLWIGPIPQMGNWLEIWLIGIGIILKSANEIFKNLALSLAWVIKNQSVVSVCYGSLHHSSGSLSEIFLANTGLHTFDF